MRCSHDVEQRRVSGTVCTAASYIGSVSLGYASGFSQREPDTMFGPTGAGITRTF